MLCRYYFKVKIDFYLFFRKLINFVESKNQESKWGYIYAVGLLGVISVQSLILHQYFHRAFLSAMQVKTSVMALVYRKVNRKVSKIS